MGADKLLSRLQRVRRTGPGKWIASCPTREDRSPSMAIRELEDGRILLHDFGGESIGAILSAIGLSFSDLFPETRGGPLKPVRRPFNASDVLALVAFESTVAVTVISDVMNGVEVTQQDYDRLLTAAQRLADAAEVCNGWR
jgi:hypothetical protein